MKFMKKMTGCTHLDFKMNLYTVKELNTQPIMEFIKKIHI